MKRTITLIALGLFGMICLSACNTTPEQTTLPPIEEYLSWDAQNATPEQMEVYRFVEDAFKKAITIEGDNLKLNKKELKKLGFPKEYIDAFAKSLDESMTTAKEWGGIDAAKILEAL